MLCHKVVLYANMPWTWNLRFKKPLILPTVCISIVPLFPLQHLLPWYPSSSNTWLSPCLANWPRWAHLSRGLPQQFMLSDASTALPLPLVHLCLQWKEVPSSPAHAVPPLNLLRLCWGNVDMSPASSPLQEWKLNLLWRGVAKTVSLLWGGGVCLCTAKQIQDTNKGRAKI